MKVIERILPPWRYRKTSTALAWANREGLRLAYAQAIIDSLVRQGLLVAVTVKGELAYKRAIQ